MKIIENMNEREFISRIIISPEGLSNLQANDLQLNGKLGEKTFNVEKINIQIA
jgi:hypothetical protein